MFRMKDAADFFIFKHVEIKGMPILLIRKAKRILKITNKEVHPEIVNGKFIVELFSCIQHASSIRKQDRHYNRMTFYDSTKQVFITNVTRHIPRSLKIGNRWCLVF